MCSHEGQENLQKLIEDAEHIHMAAGMLVDLCRAALDDAIFAQNETRRKLMELRAKAVVQ